MKTLRIIILSLLVTVVTCLNAQNIQSTQELDKTIDKLIPKAKKNKLSDKQLALFTKSYHEANEIDHKRIMKLKESGQPEIWIEIYYRLTSIDKRQNKILTLPDNIKSAMNFKQLNLNNEINNSRQKAEVYIYAKANHLLKDINEENLKEANMLVNQLRKINPKNENIEELMIKLAVMPNERILLSVDYNKEILLPEDLKQLILDFDKSTIYGVPFDVVANENADYDMIIRITIDAKFFSPEYSEIVTHEEKKDNLVAKVSHHNVSKSAIFLGKIEYIDVKNKQILINTPFDVSSYFKQNYIEVEGDKEACCEETLQLLSDEVVDFPSDSALLKGTARELNNILKNIFQEK